MFPVVFSMYLYASDLMSKADRNWFFGIRNPWTISSERVWDRTHEAASRWFKVAAFLTAPAVLYPDYSVQLYAAPAFLLALGSTVYSYWLYMEG
ncbi:MAG: SdpI family protein, partial [Candidatus Aenigmatarchaeota archaeon]